VLATIRAQVCKGGPLGSGLLVQAEVPVRATAENAYRIGWFAQHHPCGYDHLGAWCLDENVRYVAFLPNALLFPNYASHFLGDLISRMSWAHTILTYQPEETLPHTEVLDLVAHGLLWSGTAGGPPLPSDVEDLFEFAREHATLQEFWRECHRADWMIWVADLAAGACLIPHPPLNPARFDVAPLTDQRQLAAWLTAQLVQSHALRRALPDLFTLINDEWLVRRRATVEYRLRLGEEGPLARRLYAVFERVQESGLTRCG